MHYIAARTTMEVPMASLAVTAEGQITLGPDLLRHLGVKPGEGIEFEKLPSGELRIRAAEPNGTLNNFIGPLSIEQMKRITAAGWAGSRG
jgi:antitoxin PrlF